MKTRDAARKVRMGEDYECTDGVTRMNSNGAFWTQVDEQGRVRVDDRGSAWGYTTRWATQAAAKTEHGTEGDVQWPSGSRSLFGR